MKDLKARILRGGFAKTLSQVANLAIKVGSMVILARLLEPKEFGLVGMVWAVTGVFHLFKDAGLSMATIQRESVTDEQVSALFWINMAVGSVLGVVSVALAPVLVKFYGEPRLFWVTIVLGVGFVVNAAGVQHSALIQRQMRFTTLGLLETASQFVASAVAIVMAVRGYGYWALVAMSLASPLVITCGVWLLAPWVPGRPRGGAGVGSMLRFGGVVTFNSVLMYAALNLDKVLVGRFFGASALGFYGRAYQLINLPTDNLNSAVGGVAFSALSRLQDDPMRLRSYYLKGYSLVLSLTVPVTVAFTLFGTDIVLVVMGAKWLPAAPLLRCMAPTIFVWSLISPLAWLLLAMNLTGRSLRMAFVMAPTIVLGYVVGLPFGPTGVALGFSAAMLVLIVPMSAWAVHETPVSLRDLWQFARHPLLSGLGAAALGLLAQPLVGHVPSPMVRVAIESALLGLAYVGLLLYVMRQKEFYVDLVLALFGRSRAN